jgi:hypothetical protein
LVNTDLSSLEPYEDFLSLRPVLDHPSSSTAEVVADFLDFGIASNWCLDRVLVKVASVVVCQEDSAHIKVDIEPSDVVLLPDSNDLLRHWWVLLKLERA